MLHILIPAGAIFVVILILSGAARGFASRRLTEARKTKVPSNLSGSEIAEQVLREGGAGKVLVLEFDGYLTDYYDPANRRLLLCRKNFRGRSAAAWGIALHEAGHALQHKDGEGSYNARMAALRACQYLTGASLVFFAVAGLSRAVPFRVGALIVIGIWLASFLANVLTMLVEFDASSRVRELLERNRAAGVRREEVEDAMTGVAWRDLGVVLSTIPTIIYRLLPWSRSKPSRPVRKATGSVVSDDETSIPSSSGD